MYRYYLEKYIEKLINLNSHLVTIRDKNDLLDGIEDIDLYLYPFKIISVQENVTFRCEYEDIKWNKDSYYILVLKDDEIHNKILDFIKRSEDGIVKDITTQELFEGVEEDLKWNEEIEAFSSNDIKKKFNELVYYRKLIRKKNIDKHEMDKVVLSALLELDAIKIKDEVDCYLYYRDIRDIYGGVENFKYKTSVKELVGKVFSEYGSFIVNIIEHDLFEEFEQFLWVCCSLNSFGKLSNDNLKIILEDIYDKLKDFHSYQMRFVDFANLISKKDKKYYIQKKDWAENLILKTKIDILSDENSYKEILREGKGSLINILESIKDVIKDYNLEGYKKVFKYNLDHLYELNVLINESIEYPTKNVKELIELLDLMVNLFDKIEYAEKQLSFVSSLNGYNEWISFYKNHIYNLQYKLSELKHLDKQHIIEGHRYPFINKRISEILNQYRKYFAQFLKDNYNSWLQSPYGISRPVLNRDIHTLLNLDANKTYIIIFDGMRYDAWEYIVHPYFKKVFSERDTKYRDSFAMLPTITSVSREAIYSSILKKYKKDTAFLTKAESDKNENILKDIILQDKRINILIFNMFDKDGHKATEDFYIFYEKQKQVFENSITELLNMISDDSNIIVSSDHGLMRIDEYINLKDDTEVINVKPRYLNTSVNSDKEGFISIDGNSYLSFDNKGYFIGGGEKDYYSHGGVSIEEVIVPFIISESKVIKKKFTKDENIVSKTVLQLDCDTSLNLSFKLNEKENIILTSLYSLKNQNVSNRDIEKILINKVGTAGMVSAMIGRLIRKLKKDGLDIIEESAMGDLIMYKFNINKLEEINR